MDTEMELILRDKSEEAMLSLGRDARFLAIVEYMEFIYNSKLHEYEYETSREALIQTGYKVCMRELLEDINRNMKEETIVKDEW